MENRTKTLFLYALFPFAVIFGVDAWAIPRSFFITPGDAPEGLFGLGLNCLCGKVAVVNHMPDYFWGEMSALFILISGQHPSENLHAFQMTGIIFQVMVLFLALWWVARLAVRLNCTPTEIGLLSAVTASMPTAMALSRIWGIYYLLSILTFPIAMGFFCLVTPNIRYTHLATTTLTLIGFIVSTLFLAIPLVAAALTALLFLFLSLPQSLMEKRLDVNPTSWSLKDLLFVVLASVFSRSFCYQYVHPKAIELVLLSLILIALILLLRNKWLRIWSHGILFPLLGGWIIGCNIFAKYWFQSLAFAQKFKGGAESNLPFQQWVSQVNLIDFFHSRFWNWLLLIPIVGGFGGLLWRNFSSFGDTRRIRTVSLFSFIGIILTFIATAGVALRPNFLQQYGLFGIRDRYFALSPVFIIPILLSMFRSGWPRTIIQTLKIMVFTISCLSVMEYILDARPFVAHTREINQQLDRRINSFTGKGPGFAVVIIRTGLPERARVLYAYNVYRTTNWRTVNYLGKQRQIIYESSEQNIDTRAKLLPILPMGGSPERTIIISESSTPQAGWKLLWHDTLLPISVFRPAP